MKKFGINFYVLNILIVIGAISFATFIFIAQVHETAGNRMRLEQKQALATFRELLRNKGGGQFRIVNGVLLAGDQRIGRDIPEKVDTIFGVTATVFVGGTIASTSNRSGGDTDASLPDAVRETVLAKGEPFAGEVRKGGIDRIITCEPLADPEGNVIGALYVAAKKNDVTIEFERERTNIILEALFVGILCIMFMLMASRGRKVYESALRESEVKYRTLFETSIEGIVLLRDTFFDCNEQACRLFGCSRKELLGLNLVEVSPPEQPDGTSSDQVASLLLETAAGGMPRFFPWTFRRMDGTSFEAEVFLQSLQIQGGDVVQATLRDVTERNLTEQRVRDSEEKYRTVFETTGTATIIVEEDTVISLANRQYEVLSGFSKEELEGHKSWTDFVGGQDRERMLHYHRQRRISPNSVPQNYEFTFIDRHGTRKEIFSAVSMIPGTSQRVASCLDITELKQAQRAIQKMQRQQRAILDNIPDLIWLKDREGRYLTVNQALIAASGIEVQKLLGLNDFDIWPEQLARQYREDDMAVIRSGGQYCCEEELEGSDGRRTWIETIKMPVFSEDGELLGTTGVARNIEQRKRTEQALRESEERFYQLFAQNHDAIILLRLDNMEIIDANPKMISLFGYSREELLTAGPWSFMAPEDYQKLILLLATEGPATDFLLDAATTIKKDGTRSAVSILGKTIRLKELDVIYCSIRDITERIRLEEEMKSTQARLINISKMTSIGMLVSGLAHEINNPNSYIAVNAMLLADAWRDAQPALAQFQKTHGDFTLAGLPYEEMREVAPRLFDGLKKGSSRINTIVDNLRTFARKDSSSLDGRIDINSVISDAMVILSYQIHKTTDNFRLELAPDLPPARGNRQQVEQVVINLVLNALQSLPGREAAVIVTTAVEPSSDSIVISVRDQGKGMERTLLERATEPFFSTRLEEGGTGLGLSIVASIVKDHNGSLEIESTPRQGTTATVRLQRVAP